MSHEQAQLRPIPNEKLCIDESGVCTITHGSDACITGQRVCCNLLQYVAAHVCVAVRCNIRALQCATVCCSILHWVAVRCSVLQFFQVYSEPFKS